jgi:hypothetical protein
MLAFFATDSIRTSLARVRHRYGRAIALMGVFAAAIWCYAPALHGWFVQDDYVLLAIARLLQQPLQVFHHDHFPGSQFFRPLGIFAWWLATAVVDNSPRGQYFANLLLHLGVTASLYVLLQRLRPRAPINALWTAVYAVSPLATGTALWLSDRFDLIATAGSLLALAAALRHVQQPRARTLALALLWLLLAFMGKETAIVGALAVVALLAVPDARSPLTLRQRALAVGAVLALVAGWLAYRHAMLTNPQNLWLRADSIVATFLKGIGLWLRIGAEYFVADPRQGTWMRVLAALAAVGLLIAVVSRARGERGPVHYGIAAALLALIALPAAVQAPVVAVTTTDLSATTHWLDLAAESRLYHLALAGVIAALVLLTTPKDASAVTRRTQAIVAASLLALIVAWMPASHAAARNYAKQTRLEGAPLLAANAAITKAALPATGCQIYLLDAASIWALPQSGDAMIKSTTPDLPRLEHCLVLTERTPWANFVRAGALGDYAPLRVLRDHGVEIPWLVVGGAEVAYLNLDVDIDARGIPDALFLAYRDGAFIDVSAEVRSGARPVQFFNARPDQK